MIHAESVRVLRGPRVRTSVVQNSDGTLTMVFAGYRLPKPITNAGTVSRYQLWDVPSARTTCHLPEHLDDDVEHVDFARRSTTTTLLPVTSPVVVGQSQTLSATVNPVSPGTGTPTGTVTFNGASGPLCSTMLNESSPDTASCNYIYTGPLPSPDSVSASYAGDSNYATSTSVAQSITVNQDTTTTSTPTATDAGTSDPANPATVGESITFSSSVACHGTRHRPRLGHGHLQRWFGHVVQCAPERLEPGHGRVHLHLPAHTPQSG